MKTNRYIKIDNHLYLNTSDNSFHAIRRIFGRRERKNLDTKDRRLADFRLNEWLTKAQLSPPHKRIAFGAGIEPCVRETPRLTPTLQEATAIVLWVRYNQFDRRADDMADFLEVTFRLGLRTTDVSALTWVMVNDKPDIIRITLAKSEAKHVVPTCEKSRDLLKRLHERATAKNGGTPPDPQSKVFSILPPVNPLRFACDALGLPKFTLSGMRRVILCSRCGGAEL